MADKSNKQYVELSESLGSLCKGAQKHAADDKYPPSAGQELIISLKTELDDSRKIYDDAENFARTKFDEYSDVEKRVLSEYSKLCTSIYGFFGKNNQVVGDFGLQPYKPTGKKGPRLKKQA